MSLGPGVVANAGDLPGNFHPGASTGDLEAVILNLLRDVNRSSPADGGELIAKVGVEHFEPFGKVHPVDCLKGAPTRRARAHTSNPP